jgi:riboflavin synthase
MFTGIVAGQGTISKIAKTPRGFRLFVRHHGIGKKVRVGGSIAVNGCCLTATSNNKNILIFDLLNETINRTTFGILQVGEKVNLETSMKFGDEFGGHIVTGHIDCVGRIKAFTKRPRDTYLEIHPPREFMNWIIQKGSVAIDGVSLTVGKVSKSTFGVYLIPHTLKLTTLGWKREGGLVNLEGDILAKYAQKACQ